jgi:hypothetical protein
MHDRLDHLDCTRWQPHELDLRNKPGIDLERLARQAAELGLCSSDWTRTSNHPINSPKFTQVEQYYMGIVRFVRAEIRTGCLARLHVVGQLLDTPTGAFMLGERGEEQRTTTRFRTAAGLDRRTDGRIVHLTLADELAANRATFTYNPRR